MHNDLEMGLTNSLLTSAQYRKYNKRFDFMMWLLYRCAAHWQQLGRIIFKYCICIIDATAVYFSEHLVRFSFKDVAFYYCAVFVN